MNLRQACALALAVLTSSSSAWSEEAGLSKEYSRCEARSESVTANLQACIHQEYERQDKRLNLAYQQLLKQLKPQKTEELRKVQRAWVSYVDGKCTFLFDNEDFNGTLDRLMSNHCFMSERARRAEELEALTKH